MNEVISRDAYDSEKISFSNLQSIQPESDGEIRRGLQSHALTYVAEAFECDVTNEPILEQTAKVAGDSIRICIRPTRKTRERGVLMRRINEFRFVTEKGKIQDAIVPNGRETLNTLAACQPGDEVCVFTTKMENKLFVSSGNVTGIGIAHMEFESFAVEGQGQNGLRGRRTQNVENDVQFAGSWKVEVKVLVKKSGALGGKENNSPYDILCCLIYCCLFMFKQERDEGKLVDGKVPREVDLDSQASFFRTFWKPKQRILGRRQSWGNNCYPTWENDFDDSYHHGNWDIPEQQLHGIESRQRQRPSSRLKNSLHSAPGDLLEISKPKKEKKKPPRRAKSMDLEIVKSKKKKSKGERAEIDESVPKKKTKKTGAGATKKKKAVSGATEGPKQKKKQTRAKKTKTLESSSGDSEETKGNEKTAPKSKKKKSTIGKKTKRKTTTIGKGSNLADIQSQAETSDSTLTSSDEMPQDFQSTSKESSTDTLQLQQGQLDDTKSTADLYEASFVDELDWPSSDEDSEDIEDKPKSRKLTLSEWESSSEEDIVSVHSTIRVSSSCLLEGID